ncbi:RNA polymerase ECF family sigma subunit [Luteibacter sp. OK325]|uniref:RNA polymerase sigma factor n=1 Tax=Luteibacter sp. OK325 TaxID=2135670 RepID=UPI000D3CB942|nr:RNA polymerase sigma factor [Luteibacter sp. OK325]PTR35457.1 RNA polymerase ECF family sigma subunit [Luteibacter sp. OK325]
MTTRDAHRTIDAIWKIESPRLIATIARMVRDVGLAEELAQDALVVALEQWPTAGVPDNPGAWLTQTAKHRAIDRIRRERMAGRKLEALGKDMEGMLESADDALIDALDDDIGDDMLRLIFTACHPVLSIEAQVALTLRLLGGLTTDEIARAFLVPEATVAQRIVRAKRSLADAAVAYEVPRGDELKERLASVLRVVYLVFNEGYAATTGGDWMRPTLCAEAQRLGRVLAGLMPNEAEVHGLVALMEIHASRTSARTRPDGEPVLLLEQDRGRWDRLLIGLGLKALERAERLGGAKGPYALQAAIAACHARAARAEDTDWARIAALYAALVDVVPSPVVELNRAVAVSMAEGPDVALDIVESLVDEPSMKDYHLLPSVQGDLLFRLGRYAAAREAFLRAAGMTRNERERTLLEARAAACIE